MIRLLSRRAAILGAACLLAASPAMGQAQTWILSAVDARERAIQGDVLLIDIRRPWEWDESGAPDVAVKNSMHISGFLNRLDASLDGDRTRPVALICATGGRSAWLALQLRVRGYTQVYDVSEGMFGSRSAGGGWLRAGLPVMGKTAQTD